MYKLAEKFLSELESLEYCQDHCVFYIYKNNLWKSYKEEFVEKNFFNLLKLRYSQSYYNFNIKKLAEIILILKNDKGKNPSLPFRSSDEKSNLGVNDNFSLGSLDLHL